MALLQQCDNAALRRRLFVEGYRSPSSNMQRLEDLTRSRHELAILTGFGSYAEYQVSSLPQRGHRTGTDLRHYSMRDVLTVIAGGCE